MSSQDKKKETMNKISNNFNHVKAIIYDHTSTIDKKSNPKEREIK